MTATEELRALLDGRGVEYREHKSMTRGGMEPFTRFYIDDRVQAFIEASPHTEDVLLTMRCTPQQAVDATLGRGECEMQLAYEEEDADGFIWPDHYECSKCHANVNGILPYYDVEVAPKFCPSCGAKVRKAVKR